MSALRVFVVLGNNSLENLTSSLVAELFAQKAKGSISTTIDPLFGPALLFTHAKQIFMIVTRPNVRSIEKTNRLKIDAVLFNTEQLRTDNALKALVQGVVAAATAAASNLPLPFEQHLLAVVWPQQKIIKLGEKLLDFLSHT
jgi:hypothetical protein